MAWRPQTTGKVEMMNNTLKKNVARLGQETHLHWDQVLPIALLRVRVTPHGRIQLSPYEIVDMTISGYRSGRYVCRSKSEGKDLCTTSMSDLSYD